MSHFELEHSDYIVYVDKSGDHSLVSKDNMLNLRMLFAKPEEELKIEH